LGPKALDESCGSIPLKGLFAKRVGGRKRLAREQRSIFKIAYLVNHYVCHFKPRFEFLGNLKNRGRWELSALTRELTNDGLNPREIDALLASRTLMGAAKRYVAGRENLSLQTVRSCYSRFLKTKS
jgi:hypothetical protein